MYVRQKPLNLLLNIKVRALVFVVHHFRNETQIINLFLFADRYNQTLYAETELLFFYSVSSLHFSW